MTVSKISKGLLLGLALLLATSVFAANQGPLQLSDPLNVSGKQLKPGDYKLKWEGTGSSVELSILQGKNVVATVPAQLIDLNQASLHDSTVIRTNSDGSKSLSEIHFGGKKYALVLNTESAKADSSGSSK